MDRWGTPRITVVKQGMGWGEGPVYLPSARGIVFSDIDADTLLLWHGGITSDFRRPSRRANGNTVDREGRLISCEHQSRQVTRAEHDGSLTVLAQTYRGKRLNSPNDVAVAQDGGIWFTDPPYGLLRGDSGPDAVQELSSAVYRIDPATLEIDLMIDVMDKPNGLVFSRDGVALFVSDTGHSNRPNGNRHIFRFDLVDGRPRNMTVFAEIVPAACDGLRIDLAGQVWSTAGDGVHLLSAEGRELGRIDLGEMSTNLCFLPESGPAGLFVTTPTRALVLEMDVGGEPAGFCRP